MKERKIKDCNDCPFNYDTIECKLLPRYLEETSSTIYDNLDGDNMTIGIPKGCPLRKESVCVKFDQEGDGAIIVCKNTGAA